MDRVALIVEDEWLVRMEIAEAFEANGWMVLEASSGEEAVTFLMNEPAVGLLVTDIRLSGPMSGWDVAETFRATLPQLPVIYSSANRADAARMVAESAFVEKPSRMSELLTASERLWNAH